MADNVGCASTLSTTFFHCSFYRFLESTMAFSACFRSAVFLFILSLQLASAQNRQCYWPDGTTTGNDLTPCSDGDSNCCRPGDGCVSNGLCFSGDAGIVWLCKFLIVVALERYSLTYICSDIPWCLYSQRLEYRKMSQLL